MNSKSTTPIPGPIEQLQRQLDEFRSTQPHRTKLPEMLWQAAVELARQHGVYSVAHPLRLDYMGLKKRLGGVPGMQKKATAPAFVELIAAHPVADSVIEFESSTGSQNANRINGMQRQPKTAAYFILSGGCFGGCWVKIAAELRPPPKDTPGTRYWMVRFTVVV